MTFGLLSIYCNVVFFIVLLQHFIYMRAIQIDKMDSISRRYWFIIIKILKNRSPKYSRHYIIKFICFISIYYVINFDIVSSFITSNLYLEFIDLL